MIDIAYTHCSINRVILTIDKNHLCSAFEASTKTLLQCRCSRRLVLIPVHDAGTKEQKRAALPSLMRFSTFIAQTSGTFTMSVISCLPAVSACSSRSPSSQLDVTAETTMKRSLPHDFAPSPSRARKKVVSFLVRKSRFWSFRAIFFRLRRPES